MSRRIADILEWEIAAMQDSNIVKNSVPSVERDLTGYTFLFFAIINSIPSPLPPSPLPHYKC